jgi:hypothetical protein
LISVELQKRRGAGVLEEDFEGNKRKIQKNYYRLGSRLDLVPLSVFAFDFVHFLFGRFNFLSYPDANV